MRKLTGSLEYEFVYAQAFPPGFLECGYGECGHKTTAVVQYTMLYNSTKTRATYRAFKYSQNPVLGVDSLLVGFMPYANIAWGQNMVLGQLCCVMRDSPQDPGRGAHVLMTYLIRVKSHAYELTRANSLLGEISDTIRRPLVLGSYGYPGNELRKKVNRSVEFLETLMRFDPQIIRWHKGTYGLWDCCQERVPCFWQQKPDVCLALTVQEIFKKISTERGEFVIPSQVWELVSPIHRSRLISSDGGTCVIRCG